jgi:hypothetical protein
MHRSLYILFLLPFFAQAQYFQQVTAAEGINLVNTNSQQGNGVSFYDINHDGWDDLTFCTNGDTLVVYENLGGNGFQLRELIPNVTFDQKSAMWVDFDDDGDSDLMMTRNANRTRIFRNNGNWVFQELTSSESGLVYPPGTTFYGQSWADYDKDGDLDAYLCNHSYGPNALLRNNGNGTFTNVASAAGVTAGNSLSFHSAWFDYNLDGWPDLFVIHENLPMAMEIYPNKLYRNNGDGTFTDVAAAAGIDAVIQAMNIGFSDFDLDGDQDLYITDIQDGNIFYRNNGNGTFTDIAAETGLLVNSFCWSALWIDADHNGYDDLHVCTRFTINNSDYFYYNNGNGTFTDSQDPLFSGVLEDTYCSAKGDYNNDGFWDFAVTKGATTSYDLFAGIPNENHWLKFNLTGTYSNTEAVGTWIKVYANGTMHSTYTMSGEHYLGQDSQYEIISLGTASVADSVEIVWPRGLVEKLYNVNANQTLTLVEGDNTPVIITSSNDNLVICEGNELALDAGEWTSYLWSTGSSERTISVSSPNVYWVEVTNSLGYTFTGNVFVNAASAPTASLATTNPLCSGDTTGSIIVQSLTENASLVWEDGSVELDRNNLGAGTYNATILSQEGCSTSISTTLEDPAPLSSAISTDVQNINCYGNANGSISVISTDDSATIQWADENTDFVRSNLPASNYEFTVTNQFGCTYTSSIELTQPSPIEATVSIASPRCFGGTGAAEAQVSGGIEPYNLNWGMADPNLLVDGDYELLVSDANNCSVAVSFTVTQPEPLFYNLSYTNPNNGPNGSISVEPTGGTAPYGILWNDASTDFVRNNLGQGNYSFTITDMNGCLIDAETYLLDTDVNEVQEITFTMMPNPCTNGEILRIESSDLIKRISVQDLNGRGVMMQENLNSKRATVAINGFAAGIYMVQVHGEKTTSTRKLEITR